MNTIDISWEELEASCLDIANFFENKNISNIVGIARGGVIPASIIARILNIELSIVSAKSYSDKTRGELSIQSDIAIVDPSKEYLFIDDICDSGHTLNAFKELYINTFNKNIYTASLIYKTNNIFTPDFYYKILPAEYWIVFPWERLNNNNDNI